jgi:hypothetical protein
MASAAICPGATSLLTPEASKDLELQPGVVLIVVSFDASLGEFSCPATAIGSGFLYRPDGYLITNGHVAQWANTKDSGAAESRMKQAIPCLAREVLKGVQAKAGRPLTQEENDDVLGQVVQAIKGGRVHIGAPTLKVILDNGDSYQGEIKDYSDPISEGGKDIAIVKIDGRNLPTVNLGTSDGVNVGDPITVVGYPGDGIISEHSALVPTVTNGRISAVNKQDYKGTPVLQSEATINHGNSGGPAFDASGRVVGIATYTAKEASGLNFFVPIDTALEFVRRTGAPPERGPFDRIWHEALQAYEGQRWSKAHDLMGSVLEMMPGQPDAKRLQAQAAQNIPANPVMRVVDELGLPLVLGIAGFVLAILISVVAGNRFVIPKAGLMIGRDPSVCAVVLPSDAVSKQHVWVVPIDNGVAVIDRDSVNGTYVNSTDSPRINKVLLKDGDRIFVGRKSPTEIMYFSS